MHYKLSNLNNKRLSEVDIVIPHDATKLDLSDNDLGNQSGEELVKFFAKIPENVTEIDLRNNNLGNKSDDELAQIFAALHDRVTKLHLAGNQFGIKLSNELTRVFAEIFSKISKDTHRLNFYPGVYDVDTLMHHFVNAVDKVFTRTRFITTRDDNKNEKLSDMIIAGLTSVDYTDAFSRVFALIPSHIDTINLFNNLNVSNLIELLPVIPAHVHSLILLVNDFGNKSNEELAKFFAAIPSSVTYLDLGINFGNKSDDELIEIFKALPACVKSLSLSFNELYKKSSDELVKIFAAIPASVKSLSLSLNELYKKSSDELAVIFAAIPASVENLNLSFNELYKKSGDELAQVFASIPASVNELNFRGNQLYKKSSDELIKIFVAIPDSVTYLDLSHNHLEDKSGAELAQIFAAIPATITLDPDTNELRKAYHIDSLLVSYLQARKAMIDSSRNTKEYLHCSFFSIFQKSFQQKLAAVEALQSALNGENIDLKQHLSTLRNGDLGKRLRKLIKSGAGDALIGGKVKVTTVSDFVEALQAKNSGELNINNAQA